MPTNYLLLEQHELCCQDSLRDLECIPVLALEPCREIISSRRMELFNLGEMA